MSESTSKAAGGLLKNKALIVMLGVFALLIVIGIATS